MSLLAVVAAGCGKASTSNGADTKAGDAQDQSGFSVDELPLAEGRTAFSISSSAAVVGGGASKDADGRYVPTNRAWILRSDGPSEELPELPAEGFIQGLSGVQVGDQIVLGAMECNDEASGVLEAGFLHCSAPRRPVLWTKNEPEDDWTRHVVPDEISSAFDRPDVLPTGGVDLRVFGTHEGEAFLALTGGKVTRFAAFNQSEEAFRVLGDGPRTPAGWAAAPYCLDEQGTVIQARSPVVETTPEGGITSGSPVSGDLTVARLGSTGQWQVGTPLALGGLGAQATDIACIDGRDPLVAVKQVGTGPVLATAPIDTLAMSVIDGAIGQGPIGTDVTNLQVVGQMPAGDIIVQVEGSSPSEGGLGVLDETSLAPRTTTETDHGVVSAGESAFIYGDRVGIVNNTTGGVRVD